MALLENYKNQNWGWLAKNCKAYRVILWALSLYLYYYYRMFVYECCEERLWRQERDSRLSVYITILCIVRVTIILILLFFCLRIRWERQFVPDFSFFLFSFLLFFADRCETAPARHPLCRTCTKLFWLSFGTNARCQCPEAVARTTRRWTEPANAKNSYYDYSPYIIVVIILLCPRLLYTL